MILFFRSLSFFSAHLSSSSRFLSRKQDVAALYNASERRSLGSHQSSIIDHRCQGPDSPSPASGRDQDLFSRQDAKSAKEEGRTEDRRSADPQTLAILASWREAKTPPSCLRPGPRAFIALPGAGGERNDSGPSLRQFRRYPTTRQTHSFVRSQGSLSGNVPDTVTFPHRPGSDSAKEDKMVWVTSGGSRG